MQEELELQALIVDSVTFALEKSRDVRLGMCRDGREKVSSDIQREKGMSRGPLFIFHEDPSA